MATAPLGLGGFAAGDVEKDDVTCACEFAAASGQGFAVGTEAHGIHAIGEEAGLIEFALQDPARCATRADGDSLSRSE